MVKCQTDTGSQQCFGLETPDCSAFAWCHVISAVDTVTPTSLDFQQEGSSHCEVKASALTAGHIRTLPLEEGVLSQDSRHCPRSWPLKLLNG